MKVFFRRNSKNLRCLINLFLLFSIIFPSAALASGTAPIVNETYLGQEKGDFRLLTPDSRLSTQDSRLLTASISWSSPVWSFNVTPGGAGGGGGMGPPTIAWIRQFGAEFDDYIYSVAAASSGNIYVAGHVYGTLPYQINSGMQDAYIRKYDPTGSATWTVQFGTPSMEYANSIVLDSLENIYVVGNTGATLPFQVSSGNQDVYLRKYDSTGSAVWTRQFGTDSYDEANSVALDTSGNIFVAGHTYGVFPGQVSSGVLDAWIRKYDSTGSAVWTRQFGTSSSDYAYSLAADSLGNIYVAGVTGGALGGPGSGGYDAYLRKYDSSGSVAWTRQFGTVNYDYAYSVVVDSSNNIYLAGNVGGALASQPYAGNVDAFLRKYDSMGTELWTLEFGTTGGDNAQSVTLDGFGNIFVAGYVSGALPGQATIGSVDAFLRKYDSTGTIAWTTQFGTPVGDWAYSVSVDGFGNIYVGGYTAGAMPGQISSGNWDAFLVKFIQVAGSGGADTIPPPVPFPSSPPNGSPTSATPTFTWSEVFDTPSSPPVLYDLRIATNSSMALSMINKTNLATNNYTLTGVEALPPATYYWQIRARDSATPAFNYSAWSTPAWSFNVTSGGPGMGPPIIIAGLTSWAGHSFVEGAPLPSGTKKLHVAYVDSNSLNYSYSIDAGATWVSSTWVSAGGTGTMYGPSIAVDLNDKVFILYGVEAGIADGQDWEYDLYVASNVTGTITTTLLQSHLSYTNGHDDDFGTTNSGPRPLGILVDTMNQVHAFGQHYGWYGYGGATFEWIRNPASAAWSPRQTVVHIHTPTVDNSTSYGGVFDIDFFNKITFFSHNTQDGNEYYVEKPVTGGWSAPAIVAATFSQPNTLLLTYDSTNPHNLHAAYKTGADRRTVVYRQNWAPAETIFVASPGYEMGNGSINESITPKIVFNLLSSSTLTYGQAFLTSRQASGGWTPPAQLTFTDPGHEAIQPMFARNDGPAIVATGNGVVYMDATSHWVGKLVYQPLMPSGAGGGGGGGGPPPPGPGPASTTFLSGWNMWSYPLQPNPGSNFGQLSSYISTGFVFHYNATTGIYDITDVATPGWGYWTRVNFNIFVSATGAFITSPTFEIPLGSAWNQIGQPYNANIDWKNVSFRQGIVTKSLLDASAAGWISQYLYSYNTSAGLYEIKSAGDGVLRPFAGYWLLANQPGVTLIIPSP